jgi:hypothetical protein
MQQVEIPMKAAKQPEMMDGIMTYLTKKHGGNVHDKGIVTLTSKSVDESLHRLPKKAADLLHAQETYDTLLRHVADVTDNRWFQSKDEPGQWVCWDFRDLRVRPTNYTIRSMGLKSWVIEGSVDGKNWTEIDRQTDNEKFKLACGSFTGTFPVSKTVECRFIRLTQIERYKYRLSGQYELELWAIEFFGTLFEPAPRQASGAASLPSDRSPKAAAVPQGATLMRVDIPCKRSGSLDGIISRLTKTCGGNVHEKGLVTITSKSVVDNDPDYAPRAVADFTEEACFQSEKEPGEWLCWDFGEMRVRPSHYTLWAYSLKSWTLDGGDGRCWTRIDTRTNDQSFKDGWNTVSFVAGPEEFRLIKLTMTGERHCGGHRLVVAAVEFFGTAQVLASPSEQQAVPKPRVGGIAIPMTGTTYEEAVNGIIAYLTKQYGGNLHEKGIVKITSKSVHQDPAYSVKNVVDLRSDASFSSEFDADGPGQWICWDFGNMRVFLTHYTIYAGEMESWVIESSVDGNNWSEIDRQSSFGSAKYGFKRESFVVLKPAEFRFIRLTQTDKRLHQSYGNSLSLRAFEFFGTLFP